MNAPHSSSLVARVPMAPSDPILGSTEAFHADKNPKKVNLGVGVYTDDNGKVPLLECVRRAESERLKAAPPRNYLPIDGLATYDRAVQQLVFGSGNKNAVTVQALGVTAGAQIRRQLPQRPNPHAARLFAGPLPPVFLRAPCSKPFPPNGERVAAYTVATASPEEWARVRSKEKRIEPPTYSTPPTHGSQLVATVLGSPELRA